jgi:Zn-dependent protease with chaperone function
MCSRAPDELAGVIAHEMGHVAHRDGLRGTSGAAVIAVRTVLQSSYSRIRRATSHLTGRGP